MKLFTACLFCLLCLACNHNQTIDQNYEVDPINQKFPELEYFESRNWPDQVFGKQSFLRAAKQAKNDKSKVSEGTWDTQGPGNISGRISTIEFDNDGVLYLGYAKGGVYKSTDDGMSYTSLMDEEAYLAVSDIEIDPNDNETIYVGTGDVDVSIMFSIGNGVIKSTDGGDNWENIGLNEASIISRVHVDKNNSQLVFASAMGIPGIKSNNKGVYKSQYGGEDWEQILFVNDSTGIQDMIVHPNDPDIIYATGWNRFRSNRNSSVDGPDARIYRTKDGGDNWEILKGGLPEEDFSRVGLAMSGLDPNVIYVNFATTRDFHSMHKSEDGGDTWEQIAERGVNGIEDDSHGGFAWFFGQMRVNPTNDDEIFLLGVRLFRTLDGGKSWENVTNGMHVDNHELVFHENHIYVGNDGGAYRTQDPADGWNDIDNNVTGLLYKVGYNPHMPDQYYGGAQDNGMYFGNKEVIDVWSRYSGGDGFQPAFHPTNPDIWFTESQNGNISAVNIINFERLPLDDDFSGRFYWDTPYFVSPHNPNQIFLASDSLFSVLFSDTDLVILLNSRHSGNLVETDSEWQSHSITTIDQSSLNASIMYAGTSDGLVWRTLDFGANWEMIRGNMPRRFVSKIYTSPDNENMVYTCLTGYRDNEYIPHLFRSVNNGDSWEDIGLNLPPFSVNDIWIRPSTNDEELFVATDGGVYFSLDAGINWDRLGEDMPIIPILDLAYNEGNNELVVGSFARGILSFDLSQIIDPQVATKEISLNEKIKIFPNPVSDKLHIKYDKTKSVDISLYDFNGILVSRWENTTQRNFGVSTLKAGIYSCEIRNSSEVFGVKWIKI